VAICDKGRGDGDSGGGPDIEWAVAGDERESTSRGAHRRPIYRRIELRLCFFVVDKRLVWEPAVGLQPRWPLPEAKAAYGGMARGVVGSVCLIAIAVGTSPIKSFW